MRPKRLRGPFDPLILGFDVGFDGVGEPERCYLGAAQLDQRAQHLTKKGCAARAPMHAVKACDLCRKRGLFERSVSQSSGFERCVQPAASQFLFDRRIALLVPGETQIGTTALRGPSCTPQAAFNFAARSATCSGESSSRAGPIRLGISKPSIGQSPFIEIVPILPEVVWRVVSVFRQPSPLHLRAWIRSLPARCPPFGTRTRAPGSAVACANPARAAISSGSSCRF